MSFVRTVNPNGGVVYRRVMEEPFSNDHLLERILSTENIRCAWKQVRANKGVPGIDGVRQVKQFIEQGFTIAVDTDLSKFFDKVNHDVLMNRIFRRVKDKRVLKLIGKYLRAGVMVNDRRQATPTGVSQGGPLSPLLANILLDDLDKELERRGHHFVRYADDFIIMVKSLSGGIPVPKSEIFLNLVLSNDKPFIQH